MSHAFAFLLTRNIASPVFQMFSVAQHPFDKSLTNVVTGWHVFAPMSPKKYVIVTDNVYTLF
ncbi:hypothetical protein Ac2012v2_002849 [Leucoagaricus gongylophorus]